MSVTRNVTRLAIGATVLAAIATASVALVASAGASEGVAGVTIAARPSIAGPDHPITLFGTVRSGRPGEEIVIQTKDCGQSFFRTTTATRSQAGGHWATEFFPSIGTKVRAVWKRQASAPVTVGQRAMLRFAPKASDRSQFVVSVVARAQFWRRSVVIERLDRQRGTWRAYRKVVLTNQEAPGEFVWTSGEFQARLPRGTMLRALLPQSQAGPCYLTSYSLSLRTG